MAPLITHLVIGEQVSLQVTDLRSTPCVYGTFLLGCLLVDVNNYSGVDRSQTHFVGKLQETLENPCQNSCSRFLDQMDRLLQRPWDTLFQSERAFAAGYLCHLAADEAWKQFGRSLWKALGITSPDQLPVPADILLTAFGADSGKLFIDFPTVASALSQSSIPDIFTHVPHAALCSMWSIVQDYVLERGTPDSYFDMLARTGKSPTEVRDLRRQHQAYWTKAVALTVENRYDSTQIRKTTEQAVGLVSRLALEPNPKSGRV